MYPEDRAVAAKASINEIPDKARRAVVHQWVSHLRQLQAQAIRTAGKFSSLVRHRIAEDSPVATREFSVGSWVVVEWRGSRPATKLSVKYRGPYEVLERLSGNTYRLRDPADDARLERHAKEMFPYFISEGEDVRDTIAMDEFEDLVSEVLDHRRLEGSTSLRDLDFKIRWAGCGPDEDTWHPYSEMTRKGGLAAFWKYVGEHPELGIKVKT